MRGWVCAAIPRRARAVLDARAVTNAAELVDALQDHLILESERTEGQAAISKGASSEASKERPSVLSVARVTTRQQIVRLGREVPAHPDHQRVWVVPTPR